MRRLLLGLVFVSSGLGLLGVGILAPATAAAKGKKEATAPPAAGKMNACGCYADAQGRCFCGRKGKCSCPGECEPKGCEEKRAKELEKEVAAETKRAAEADRKQKQRSIEAEKKEMKADKDKDKDKDKKTQETRASP